MGVFIIRVSDEAGHVYIYSSATSLLNNSNICTITVHSGTELRQISSYI